MKFVGDRNELAQAVTNASSGIPSNPAMPIRAGMLIKSYGDGYIAFTGSDGDITFKTWCSADIPEEGEVIVPGKLFSEVIRSFSGQEISFTTSDNTVIVKSGRSEFTCRCYKDEYPKIPEPAPKLGTVDSELFADAVKKIVPATGKDGSNPALAAILLETKGDTLSMVTTDKYRIAVVTLPWTGTEDSCLIPGWVAERFTRGATGSVSLGWDDRVCSMEASGFAVTVRLVEGEFPGWRKHLPSEPPDVEVDAGELAAAVKRAKLTVFSDATPVELRFTGGMVYVESGDSGNGFRDSVECSYTGEEFAALFGIGKLLDGLTGCDESCFFGFTAPLKPVYLKSGSFVYTIVPRRRI